MRKPDSKQVYYVPKRRPQLCPVAHRPQRVTIEAARVRVARLEAALSALADQAGPEVDALKAVLTRARVAAFPPLVDVQVSQCQQFIDRTVKRMNELDRVREVEAARLQEARDPVATVATGTRRSPHNSPASWGARC